MKPCGNTKPTTPNTMGATRTLSALCFHDGCLCLNEHSTGTRQLFPTNLTEAQEQEDFASCSRITFSMPPCLALEQLEMSSQCVH